MICNCIITMSPNESAGTQLERRDPKTQNSFGIVHYPLLTSRTGHVAVVSHQKDD